MIHDDGVVILSNTRYPIASSRHFYRPFFFQFSRAFVRTVSRKKDHICYFFFFCVCLWGIRWNKKIGSFMRCQLLTVTLQSYYAFFTYPRKHRIDRRSVYYVIFSLRKRRQCEYMNFTISHEKRCVMKRISFQAFYFSKFILFEIAITSF